MDFITEKLIELSDRKHKSFLSGLIPNVNKDLVLGVKIPKIRKLAKEIQTKGQTEQFLQKLPHKYLEENILHGILICNIKDIDECICELDRFLPFVDNWAVCDSIRPKCFKNSCEKAIFAIDKWIVSEKPYVIRFAIEMLMTYFMDSSFSVGYLIKAANVKSDEYYVNMMIAWYFSTALAKQWKSTLPFIEQKTLPVWVHNKTVQKAIESYRITEEQKLYLKSLKIKT